MITTIFTNMMSKLSVKPEKISVGPGFHKDMASFAESMKAKGSTVFCIIDKTHIYLDPLIQGKRVKVCSGESERTFNYKTFVRNDRVEFKG